MRHLRLPARVHDVDLRRHLILGSEPCGADQGQHVVGVVISEDSRVVDRQLVQCTPDSIVCARLGEVIPGLHARGLLRRDQGLECLGRAVHDRGVKRLLKDYDARSGQQCLRKLGLDFAASLLADQRGPNPPAIDEHVLSDIVRPG